MKNMKKRLVAGLLAAIMTVSSMQFQMSDVYAKEGDPEAEITVVSDEPSVDEEEKNEEEKNEEADKVEEITEDSVVSDEPAVDEEEKNEEAKSAEVEGAYQFGDSPTDDGYEYAEPSSSMESGGLVQEINDLTVEEYIHQEMLKRSESIDILDYRVKAEDLSGVVGGIFNDYPDLYFVIKRYSYYSTVIDDQKYITRILFEYDAGYDDAAFQSAARSALSVVKADMSDLQKAILLHDYLTINCEYDNDNYLNGTIPQNSYSAYGALVDHVAVCQGYALAYKYLLGQAGIDCYMVSSDKMNHAWNLIVLDGKYYQVDVTWDDPVWDRVGRAVHSYMFVSDAVLSDSVHNHHDWEVTSGSKVVDYKATDTKYDNAFWSDVQSPLILSGENYNDCYFTYYDTDAKSARICKSFLSDLNGSGNGILDIGRWNVWGSSGFWQGAYSGLFEYHDRLYFNDATSIYSVNFDGSDKRMEFTADTSAGYIYGIALRDGKVLYCLHQSPNLSSGETVLEADIEIEQEAPEEVPVERIELNANELTLEEGESANLEASIYPDNATNTEIIWKSSDASVASVDSGLVTALSAGSCVITASSGEVSADCSVTVNAKEVNDNIAEGVSGDIVWQIDKDGNLTVSGEGNFSIEDGFSPWYDFREYILSAQIEVSGMTDASYMLYGCSNMKKLDLSDFDAAGLNAAEHMLEGCDLLEEIYTPSNLTLSVSLPAQSGKVWMTQDNEVITKLPQNMDVSMVISKKNEVPVFEEYIAASKTKTEYTSGDKLTLDDLTVTYFDEEGKERALKENEYTTNASEIDMTEPGEKELIITYGELTTLVKISVKKAPDEEKPLNKEGLKIDFEKPDKEYIYTGYAITPEVKATYNGEKLVEGIDYTVKYSNNIKASEAAKVIITGKGNLVKSKTLTFKINKKHLDNTEQNIGDEEIPQVETAHNQEDGDYVTVAEGAKISPLLTYNGVKLTGKDFVINDGQDNSGNTIVYKNYKWKKEDDGKTITVSAVDNGNYTGSRKLKVKVISKEEQKKNKIVVSIESEAKNITYDGGAKDISDYITVSAKNSDAASLKEGVDYIISYPEDMVSAGSKKFTVAGISEKCMGTVTKSITIKPKKMTFAVEYDQSKAYVFTSAGTKIDDIRIKDGNTVLSEGKDYKISYSGNKKVGNNAKFTVTGLGNYKGSKGKGTFTVSNAILNNNPDRHFPVTKGLEIEVADMVFKKPGIYKSKPYVSIDGILLKASNYDVKYYLEDPAGNPDAAPMDKNNKVTDENADTTVWVKIVGKGNYKAAQDTNNRCYVTASYKVRSKSQPNTYNLSKAKVSFVDKNGKSVKKVEYTGLPISKEDIRTQVTYKIGKDTVTLTEGIDYKAVYVNNVNKGKATVIINTADNGVGGGNKYVGSKIASFSITADNLSL